MSRSGPPDRRTRGGADSGRQDDAKRSSDRFGGAVAGVRRNEILEGPARQTALRARAFLRVVQRGAGPEVSGSRPSRSGTGGEDRHSGGAAIPRSARVQAVTGRRAKPP